MHRLLFLFLLFVSAGLSGPAAAQTGSAEGLPPRPSPFQFVNDRGRLMAPGDVKKLESGLRRYAENTGTQVVVVTVPSLGGRDVADYGRALGTAWGVGQRDKNNGVVVLVSAQDRKVTIQPGSGLRDQITPAVTNRAIAQMSPSFKQGNYFAGLRAGLNTIMLAANPGSAPESATGASPATAGTAAGVDAGGAPLDDQGRTPVATAPNDPMLTPPTSEPDSGPGMGTILLIALVVGGIIYFWCACCAAAKQPQWPTTCPRATPTARPISCRITPTTPTTPTTQITPAERPISCPTGLTARPAPAATGPARAPATTALPTRAAWAAVWAWAACWPREPRPRRVPTSAIAWRQATKRRVATWPAMARAPAATTAWVPA
ncbi:TPM domain-containing protein [Hymenobacter humi]|uniref:TPM domain-containing protein n=1 Tax=Hymenobacter humi TaxID=1411620 RepID=A0ABW2U161_9BACT